MHSLKNTKLDWILRYYTAGHLSAKRCTYVHYGTLECKKMHICADMGYLFEFGKYAAGEFEFMMSAL